jgi:hypothetical protein
MTGWMRSGPTGACGGGVVHDRFMQHQCVPLCVCVYVIILHLIVWVCVSSRHRWCCSWEGGAVRAANARGWASPALLPLPARRLTRAPRCRRSLCRRGAYRLRQPFPQRMFYSGDLGSTLLVGGLCGCGCVWVVVCVWGGGVGGLGGGGEGGGPLSVGSAAAV